MNNLSFTLGFNSTLNKGGGGLPVPPTGFLFLVDTDDAYLTDLDGAYLMEAA